MKPREEMRTTAIEQPLTKSRVGYDVKRQLWRILSLHVELAKTMDVRLQGGVSATALLQMYMASPVGLAPN